MVEPRPRVVVVDDDTSMRKAVGRLLHVADFEPLTFASAEALLAAPAAASAACFVLDIRLPGLSGFALHAKLRADGCHAPVIFITAHDDAAARQRAVSSDAVDYLPKPFLGTLLLESIHRALDSRGATH